MPITDSQKKHYAEEGHIILEDFFTEREMDALAERLDAYDEESERVLEQAGQQFISIPKQINFTANLNFRDAYVQQFTAHDKMVELTTSLLGPDIKLYWDQTVYKRSEARRDFPWHQDNGYALTIPEHYLTCWIAVNDATLENGCIWIQPRSHLKGLVEHKKTDIGWQCYFGEDPGTPVPLRKGSMVAFHSLLFHRSGPNLSNGMRKAYIVQYSQADARHGVSGFTFDNGPIIALDGKKVYSEFYTKQKE